ncbi:MAG: histidine phosphatase family protein [Gammaproteobacteria bacterium]|nr:histidine phosphatase family protein [Gammaproteobacteria bacterium]
MQTLNRLIALCIAIAISGVLVSCTARVHSKPGTETTIILTRHAERTIITKILTDRGRARAKELVKTVGDMKITAIYSPDLVRNLDTVRPLAKHLGIDITVVSSKPEVDEIVETMLTRHAGEIVLWVGNTANLSGIYYALGGEGEAPDNFGDLFILKIKDQGFPEVIKKKY